MCNVSCPTGAETLAHLSSKEHTQGLDVKPVEAPKEENKDKEDKEETAGDKEENKLDPSEIINKFFCDVCKYVLLVWINEYW